MYMITLTLDHPKSHKHFPYKCQFLCAVCFVKDLPIMLELCSMLLSSQYASTIRYSMCLKSVGPARNLQICTY